MICHAESIPVGLDTVTAMGMVVAELVANSFEHAFPMGEAGPSPLACAGLVGERTKRS